MRRQLIAIAALALFAAACAEASPESAQPATDLEAPMTEVTVAAEDPAPAISGPDHEEQMITTVAPSSDHDESTPAEDAGHDHDDAAPAEDAAHDARQVEVVMTEFAFEPSHISVTAGETVRFLVRNEGVIEHEFRLTTHHEVDEHLAGGHDDHHSDSSDSPMMLLLDPGAIGELEVFFSESGEFELYACMIEGHYEAGMAGDLITG